MASVKQAWIKKYGEEEGLRRWNELNKGKGTLDWYINRYGKQVGTSKYYEKNKKLSVSVDALRLNGKTDVEIAEIRDRHSIKSKHTLENMIERYGEEKGVLRYNQYRYKNKLTSNRRLDYWIEKYDGNIDLAKTKFKEWQSRDLQWFINKYGDIDGVQRYNNTNKKRGRLLENYIKKYGNVDGLRNYQDACKKWKDGQRGIFNSSGQLEVEEFLNTLFENVKGSRNETGIILTDAEKSKEIQNNTLYPDIIVNDKYIIRYNGDFWHANKTMFPDDNSIVGRINKPAGLIREIDRQKNVIYKNRGFIVINIWDSDWQTKKDIIKQYLIKEIK